MHACQLHSFSFSLQIIYYIVLSWTRQKKSRYFLQTYLWYHCCHYKYKKRFYVGVNFFYSQHFIRMIAASNKVLEKSAHKWNQQKIYNTLHAYHCYKNIHFPFSLSFQLSLLFPFLFIRRFLFKNAHMYIF